ncbi:MAG: SIS domain-containing protein [Patescibacteria group bacterium]
MNLDNHKIYQKLNKGQVAKSIELLPDQIRQVLGDARLIKIPSEYSKVTQIVVNGMGGSNLGAGIIKASLESEIKVPITITPGYRVPAFVNKNTLYLISSYSGSTEEPLSVYQEIKKRKAKIMAITSHGQGKLEKLMLKDNIPGYIFKPEFNPSNQPRLGLGYSIFGTAVILAKSGLFKINVSEINDLIANLEIWSRELRPIVKTKTNEAKKIASAIYNKKPIIVGAEFLIGNLRTMRNQFCENSKNFASYLTLPELNHYALESLANPKSNINNLIFLFFDSKLYHPQIQKRSQLTKQVIKKNKIAVLNYELKSKTKFAQAFEMLQIGSWITYYLAILNQVNPAIIPWVDWFKKELK